MCPQNYCVKVLKRAPFVCTRQLLGVRRPGAALLCRTLSKYFLLECFLTARRQAVRGHSGAGPPHSKELKLAHKGGMSRCRVVLYYRILANLTG